MRRFALSLALLSALAATPAVAGVQSIYEVNIGSCFLGKNTLGYVPCFSGALADVRNSLDEVQILTCSYSSLSDRVNCWARNAAGVTSSCVNDTADANHAVLRDSVRSINGDDYVWVAHNQGICLYMEVRKGSHFTPKQ